MIPKIVITILIFFFCMIPASGQNSRDPVVIDESQLKDSVVQVIEIDRIWSGHPVGFALLTHNNRQYIAYYNADRHMVVGQRDLRDDKFSLYMMPPTYRESAGGTSTVHGWDSHNYIAMDIDKRGISIFPATCMSIRLPILKAPNRAISSLSGRRWRWWEGMRRGVPILNS